MPDMIFACLVTGSNNLAKALILAESIRAFAGDHADRPVWLLVPAGKDRFLKANSARIEELDIGLQEFELDSQAAKFPFASKVVAAAAAESLANGMAAQLVWMDTPSMVINPPDAMLLSEVAKLGCRPVDHLLIGSPYDQPLDPFWELVYSSCGVGEKDVFPMVTSADEIKIRPYLNAGMLVVRPESRLLQRWRDTFLNLYQDGKFLDFYHKKRLYKIFIHQAVLSAVALATLERAEIMELPHLVNYPLHMHTQYPSERRPRTLNELVSFRYENFFTEPDWQEQIQVDPPLHSWLDERFKVLSHR
ncbi:MAG: hypothetical protein JSW42_09925 [Chloroflexota bacterium]|nr:MAG: hypothetical protein JSW42_09925 [Chloroflexota bacterium]